MKKVLLAAALALAVGAPQAHAQGGGVRVGPAADDAAPAPKKEEKKAARPPQTTPPAAPTNAKDGGDEAARPAAAEPKIGEEREPKKAEDKREEAVGAKPSGALPSNTATAAAPVETSTPSVTTDAPAKLPANGVVPVAPPTTGGDPPTADSSTNTTSPNTSSPNTPSTNTSSPAVLPSTNGAPPPATADAEKPSSATSPGAPSSSAAAPPSSSAAPSPPSASAPSPPLTSIYRIGVGDVLDIRLLNQSSQRESTLFTVMTGGILEYPLAGDPLVAEGMTPEELGARLAHELKRRAVYEQPQVVVSVREYSSHAVLVSGLAGDPGTKILRREAIPLYVLIAEAQPKPEAGRALVISHRTGKSASVDLSDAAALNMLVHPGDVVTLATRPREYFYVGGEVNAPGQKDFHAGLTLTQAVLASGGVTRSAGRKVRVLRQGADGRLVPADYNLREIEEGKVPDPVLQAGDRVEVSRDR